MQNYNKIRLRAAETIVIFLFAVFIPVVFAEEEISSKDYNTTFFRANNLYREEKYDDAIADYERLISAGLQSANVFYNLGNAYLRTGSKGKAILYYERAFRMRPRDSDIRSNLIFARTLVEGDAGQYGKQWYERVFLFLWGILSTDELTVLASVLYFATMAFLALGIFFKARRRLFYYSAAAFLAVFIIVLPSLIGSVHESGFQKSAVIMTKEMEVRFEPNDDATLHFKLYEGSVVKITKSQGDWHQVKRYDGKMGWMKGDVFTVI